MSCLKHISQLRTNHYLIFSRFNSTLSQQFFDEFKTNHVETTPLQKSILAAGSSFMSLMDPSRADMIATLGETTGRQALKYMYNTMLDSPEGREILQEMPRVNSKTIDIEKLADYPKNTFGYAYWRFLEKNKVTPDSRGVVKFVDDYSLAYVMQRYREVHDFIHTVLEMPTNMLGEVTVKWVEGIQTRMPMCLGGGLFGAVRLAPKQREKYLTTYLPWAIQTGFNAKFLLNVYYEKRWDQPLDDLHKEMNIKRIAVPPKPKKEDTS